MEADAKTSQFPLTAQKLGRELVWPSLALAGSKWASLSYGEIDLKPQAWVP